MQLTIPLTPKMKLALAGVVILLGALLALPFLFRHEPTADELRAQHMQYLVKLLELYKQQYGFYPQPAARREAAEGIRHVWGYRAGKPALASCTAPGAAEGKVDAWRSFCGGGIHDAMGKIVGWKGTLAPESALNSVEVAEGHTSRLASPLGTIAEEVPRDPELASDPVLREQGFGEYVYAVRAPEDGAEGRGGTQYQLAMTVTDPATGKRVTRIEGDYFVSSEEQDLLPASLIGPGILFDHNRNPLPSRPLDVLLDGQREGYPNPVIGEGEKILRLLALRTKEEKLLQAVEARRELAEQFSLTPAREALLTSLRSFGVELHPIAETPGRATGMIEAVEEGEPATPVPGEENLDELSTKVGTVADNLAQALRAFLHAKSEEVHAVLQTETGRREDVLGILSGALLAADEAHHFVLLARDELVKYLAGEGIEDQARLRARKKIASAIGIIPDLPQLFTARDIPFSQPFLPEELQKNMDALARTEALTEIVQLRAPGTGSTARATASGKLLGSTLPSSAVMVTTVVAETTILFTDLQKILTGVQADLENLGVSLEDTDAALQKLSRVLGEENERIRKLFADLADPETAALSLQRYEVLLSTDEMEAVREAAAFARLRGDFSGFLFNPAFLESVSLERQPGIPDLAAREDPWAAEYRGVPYPLP